MKTAKEVTERLSEIDSPNAKAWLIAWSELLAMQAIEESRGETTTVTIIQERQIILARMIGAIEQYDKEKKQ